MAGLVERPDAAVLDENPKQADTQWREQESEPEVADELDHRVEEIGAEGEERAVGEVGNVQHARDDAEPDAHERVEHARGEPVQDLAEKQRDVHEAERFATTLRCLCRRRIPRAAASSPSR